MVSEADANNEQNLDLYWKGHPEIRWNWKELSFYKISNAEEYNKRFDLFREFYNDFYEGVRTYPEDPISSAECYSYADDKVTFALFNSCKRLDHLFFDMSNMQVIHALHREFFGIIIFMAHREKPTIWIERLSIK